MPVMTGLNANEMYCLRRKGLEAGDLVVGNSVYSMGLLGGIGSGVRTLLGGEVTQVTQVVHDGRLLSYQRLMEESRHHGATGLTGVSSELVMMGSNIEFLSVGSCVLAEGRRVETPSFSTSADGQELYCQLDAGFAPVRFVFGNVAYSIGVGGGILGAIRSLRRGEVPEYSDIFNHTRHLALERITAEARAAEANAVLGIQTSIVPFRGMQEMVMLGTASHHPALAGQGVVTSDLTNQEMWNLVHLGFLPQQLLLSVSVYSLGFVGKITSFFKSLSRGEIGELTHLIYEARENAIGRLRRDAEACGADDVAGIHVYVYELGSGLIEFMAMGTAVKRVPGVQTASENLPYQAVIEDQDTYFNTTQGANSAHVSRGQKTSRGPWDIFRALFELGT